jgi:hypothetical protein
MIQSNHNLRKDFSVYDVCGVKGGLLGSRKVILDTNAELITNGSKGRPKVIGGAKIN